MVEAVIFNKEAQAVLHDNLDKLLKEFPDQEELILKYQKKPDCKCRGELFLILQRNNAKFNKVMSEAYDRPVEMTFGGPLNAALVVQLSNADAIKNTLDGLKKNGVRIQHVNVCPAHEGGYILTCI